MKCRIWEIHNILKVEVEPETGVKVVLSTVYKALSEKRIQSGKSDRSGYIMSGDHYITNHKNAEPDHEGGTG